MVQSSPLILPPILFLMILQRQTSLTRSNMAIQRKSIRHKKNTSMLETRPYITVGEVAILEDKI